MRAFDPTAHNVLANHPEVIRWLEWNPDDGLLLFNPQCEDRDNYIFLHNGDQEITVEEVIGRGQSLNLPTLAMIFQWSSPGVYEMHTMSHPDHRGRGMFRDAKALIREMFTEHGAERIWGRCPTHNRAAQTFNRIIGGKVIGSGHHWKSGPVTFFQNDRDEWMREHRRSA